MSKPKNIENEIPKLLAEEELRRDMIEVECFDEKFEEVRRKFEKEAEALVKGAAASKFVNDKQRVGR